MKQILSSYTDLLNFLKYFSDEANSAELNRLTEMLNLSDEANSVELHRFIEILNFSDEANSAQLLSMFQLAWSAIFCQLPRFIETRTTNSAFLWYRSQRDVHLFCKFRTTFTWTNTVRTVSYRVREFFQFPSKMSSISQAALVTTSLAQWLRRPPREQKIPGSNPACAGVESCQ